MNLLKKETGQFPVGIWLALLVLLLTFLAWVMQVYSLFDWEGAVKLGFQNSSFKGDILEQTMAIKERGEAIADIIWVLPLNVIAFIGLLSKKFIGFIAAMMTFAICVYFPLFYVFQLWNTTNFDTAIGAIVLWGFPSLIGIIGLWTNRKLLSI